MRRATCRGWAAAELEGDGVAIGAAVATAAGIAGAAAGMAVSATSATGGSLGAVLGVGLGVGLAAGVGRVAASRTELAERWAEYIRVATIRIAPAPEMRAVRSWEG
jgi:hypothetical protein